MAAVFVGRFQPFHKGHLKAIDWILKKENFIFIVIGSSNEFFTQKNPLPFSKRKEMIEKVLINRGIKNFKVLGAKDVKSDKVWAKNILNLLKVKREDVVVYTKNPWTKKSFEEIGVKVKTHPLFFKSLSATKIRQKIRNNEKWEHFVPKEMVEDLKKLLTRYFGCV